MTSIHAELTLPEGLQTSAQIEIWWCVNEALKVHFPAFDVELFVKLNGSQGPHLLVFICAELDDHTPPVLEGYDLDLVGQTVGECVCQNCAGSLRGLVVSFATAKVEHEVGGGREYGGRDGFENASPRARVARDVLAAI